MKNNLIFAGFFLVAIALYVIWGNLSSRIVIVESDKGSYIYTDRDEANMPVSVDPVIDVDALREQLALLEAATSANARAIETIVQRLDRIEDQGGLNDNKISKVQSRETIYFERDNSNLMANEMIKIDRLLESISDNAIVSLRGHADTVGDNRYNHLLSLRRAAAVKRYMDEKLRAESRNNNLLITINGTGEESVVNSTADDVDEPANRIVEILVFE